MGVELHPLGFSAFWEGLREEGHTVGVLDVPFASHFPAENGFEVTSWAPHYTIDSPSLVDPPALREMCARWKHPYQERLVRGQGPDDREHLGRILGDARAGLTQRTGLLLELMKTTAPELTIAIYQELHHASHYGWHTVAPKDDVYAGEELASPPDGSDVTDVYVEVDRQLGRLLETVLVDTTILIFSLNGMQPSRGVPNFFSQLLVEWGYASRVEWRTLGWREKVTDLLRRTKQSSPRSLKTLYHRLAGQTLQRTVASTTSIDPYDWSSTRAFALPPEDWGVVRINLKGRERDGVVEPADYRVLIDELAQRLADLTAGGEPLVTDVIKTVSEDVDPTSSLLPDLVVHWTPAAHRLPLKVDGLSKTPAHFAPELTGHHNTDGWWMASGPAAELFPETIENGELHKVMSACLRPT
jgi:predicted AlkP superfamily phosphohydrolase/phosphomutase